MCRRKRISGIDCVNKREKEGLPVIQEGDEIDKIKGTSSKNEVLI